MDAFTVLERTMMKWIVQSYQRRTLRRAVRQAYFTFAHHYPNWVAALFDEHLVITHMLPMLQRAADAGDKVTPAQVAELWIGQVSLSPTSRQKYSARIVPAVSHFLCMVADELAESTVGHNANVLVETAVG